MDIEAVSKHRDEVVYPALFGQMTRGIYPLTEEVFKPFNARKIDPRWLTMGVMEFGPTPERPTYLYVTTGYSNPLDADPADYDPEGESGAGVEFAMETEAVADWAIMRLLSVLAFDILLSAGQIQGGQPLAFGDRIPLHHPINGNDRCPLLYLLLIKPETLPEIIELPSGKALIVELLGVTKQERDFFGRFGLEHLADKLRAAGAYPVTRPDRDSVV